jgi:hypothetical protein
MEPNASPPTNYLEFPDGTQQSSGTTSSGSDPLLSSANDWTNTNAFTAGSTTTTASAGDNSTNVATTEFVNTAITNAVSPLIPSAPTTTTFILNVPSQTFTIPINAYGYSWSLQGNGGFAGQTVYQVEPGTGYGLVQGGGMGGGAGASATSGIGLESSVNWGGQVLTITAGGSGGTCSISCNGYTATVNNGTDGVSSTLTSSNLNPAVCAGGAGGSAVANPAFGGILYTIL